MTLVALQGESEEQKDFKEIQETDNKIMNFLDIRYYNFKLIKQMKAFGIPPIRIDEG